MSRTVTGIEEISKARCKVYLEEEFAFVLYKGELSAYGIKLGKSLSEENYRCILNEVLSKRAKKRSLNLLKSRPYTEKRLREKLKEGGYPDAVIEEALEYVKSYHYVDDYDYACQYIEYRKAADSRRKLEEALRNRGISGEILEQAFGAAYESREEQEELEKAQIRRLLEKRGYDPAANDYKEKQKLFAYLMRKGFSGDLIRRVMEDYALYPNSCLT